ncbi:MAG TPA: DUF58 domain-containing protein, partial [Acidimicrobiales bacterium]
PAAGSHADAETVTVRVRPPRPLSRARPARPLAPMGVSVAGLGAWWLVAHNSGAGWVQALGDVVFGMLVVGIVGPALVLARARIRVVAAPTDGTAGMPVEVGVEATTRLRVRPAYPPGPDSLVGPVGRHRPPDGSVTLLPARRGVFDTITLDIATAAPFALQWWTRRVVVPLPSTLYVAPRRGQPIALPRHGQERADESVRRVSADTGEPRGARPYRAGDHRRHVHWRATAHAGELMVREQEQPSGEPVRVEVVLPADLDAAERLAERAVGTVMLLLDRGASVVLATIEPDGPVHAAVADRRAVGRRLARAVGLPGAMAQEANGDRSAHDDDRHPPMKAIAIRP